MVAADSRTLCPAGDCPRGHRPSLLDLILAVFVAVNQIQSAFTGWCPMMAFLRRLGVQE